MTWNWNLYWYWKEHGGQYFAARDREWDGTLLLQREEVPFVIGTEATGGSRAGELSYRVGVRTQLTLERPYTLHITPANLMWTGVNQVMSGLSRGAKALGVKVNLYQDYPGPKALERRRITTSEPAFTKWVLQSQALCDRLQEHEKWGVRIDPMGLEEGLHQVTVYAQPEDCGVRPEEVSLEWEIHRNPREMGKSYREGDFDRTLTLLVELAEEARAAVTAWPMPLQGQQTK